MTAMQYLSRIHRLDQTIKNKRKEYDELMEVAIAMGGIDYAKDRVQVSPSGDAAYTRAVGRMIDLDDEIKRLEAQFDEMTAKMDGICDDVLTLDELMIIRLRYYHGWKWDDIMQASESNPSTVFRWHTRALEKLETQDIDV